MSVNLRRIVIGVALAALFAPVFLPAAESQEEGVVLKISDDMALTLSGELRTRYEYDDNLVDFNDDFDDSFGFVPSRARVGLRVDLPKNIAFQFDMQDTFAFGEDTLARNSESYMPLPGTALISGEEYAWRDDLGLYQAYVEAAKIGGSDWSMRFGRQELAFGNQWMLGNNEFYGGASYDGIRGWWNLDKGRLDLFWAKIDEQNVVLDLDGDLNATDDDTDLFGVYYAWPEVGGSMINLDLYGMGVKSNYDEGAEFHSTSFANYFVGVRAYRQPEWGLHFNAEGTYEFGDITADDLDIAAWGFEGSVGYTWDLTGNPDIHGGVTYASGDDDPLDDEVNTFSAPNPDPHRRLGFADVILVGGQQPIQPWQNGIQAWQIGYAGSWENQAWGLELYGFETAEDTVNNESDLGNEIDVWYAYQYSKNLSLQLVYGVFMVGDVIEDEVGPDDAQRMYANVVLKF